LSERLRRALGRIPAKQAEAFCMHSLEGLTYREIAEQLAVSVDSVGVLVHRARTRLRQLLGASLEITPSAGGDPRSGSGPLCVRKEPL
jgi:RNA polymerase sigma-70 factor (ECF subfamily)